jgi:hypothetical protein
MVKIENANNSSEIREMMIVKKTADKRPWTTERGFSL